MTPTDPAPPTDEELCAEILELLDDSPGHTVTLFRNDVYRLIAALRASRVEVDRLREESERLRKGETAEVER